METTGGSSNPNRISVKVQTIWLPDGEALGGTPTADNVATSGAMTANSVSLNGTLQSAYTPSGSPSIYPTRMSINTDYRIWYCSMESLGSNPNVHELLPHGLGKHTQKLFGRRGGYTSDAYYNWDTLFQWLLWWWKLQWTSLEGLSLNSSKADLPITQEIRYHRCSSNFR